MNLPTIRTRILLAGGAVVLAGGAVAAGAAAQASSATAPTTGLPVTATADAKAAPAADAENAGVTFMVECVEDNRVQKPTTFTLACADDNQRLEQLTWTNWGGDTAQATGIVRANASSPMSKGDTWITYPVAVKASDLVHGEATQTYGTLTVSVVGKAPEGVQEVEVFSLPGNEPAKELATKAETTKPTQKINHLKGWSDGHENMSDDPIDHQNGWTDGHENMSDDPIDHENGWSDGHEGMSEDPIDHSSNGGQENARG